MLSFFPLDVLDELSDVIESVSEGFSYLLLCSVETPFSSMLKMWLGLSFSNICQESFQAQ